MDEKIERRSLGKASVFSAEILALAPADLAINRLSTKYRDLRKMLLNALTQKSWGVRINLSSDSKEDLNLQVRNLTMAGKSWERSIKLQDLHGVKLITHYVINKEKLEATIDLFFEGIDQKS